MAFRGHWDVQHARGALQTVQGTSPTESLGPDQQDIVTAPSATHQRETQCPGAIDVSWWYWWWVMQVNMEGPLSICGVTYWQSCMICPLPLIESVPFGGSS